MCQILLINTLPCYKKHHTVIKEGDIALFIAKINLRFCLMLIVSPFISAGSQNSYLLTARFVFLRRNNEAREHRYR